MIFKIIFFLASFVVFLNAKVYEFMPGKYTLEFVLTDSQESYPASMSFIVNDMGTINSGKINYPTYDCKAIVDKFIINKNSFKFHEKMLFGYDSCSPSTYILSVNKKYFYNPFSNKYIKFGMFDGEENVQVKIKSYNYKKTKYASFRIKHKIKNNNQILNTKNSNLLRQFISLVKDTTVKNIGKSKLTKLTDEEKREYLNANKMYTLSAYRKYLSKYPASKFIKKAKLKIAQIEKEQLIASYRKIATVDSYYKSYKLSHEDIDIKKLLLKIKNLNQLKVFSNKHQDLLTHQLVKDMYVRLYREQDSAEGYYNSFVISKNDDDVLKLLTKINKLEELKGFILNKTILKKNLLIQTRLANLYRDLHSIEGYMNAYELLEDKKDLKNILALSRTQSQLESFLSLYSNDDNSLTYTAKKRLQTIYRKKNNFFGFVSAYKLFKDLDDLKHAYLKSKSLKEKAMIEKLSFERVKTKEAMLQLQLSTNEPNYTKNNSNGGMFSQSTQYGYVHISGNIKVKFSKDLPYEPTFGRYMAKVKLMLTIPMNKQVRSKWIGNSDSKNDISLTKTVSLQLNPDYDLESENFDFTKQVFVYFDRGIQGGFTAKWPADVISVKVLSVDLSWIGEELSSKRGTKLDFDRIETYQKSLNKPKAYVNGVYNKGVKWINSFANNNIGEYKSYSGSSSSSSSSSTHKSTKNKTGLNSTGSASKCKNIANERYRGLCQAIANQNISQCQWLGKYANYCRAVISNNDSYCSSGYMGDKEMRGLCRAHINNNDRYCLEIKDGSDLKKFCKKQCYYISDQNMRRMCRAIK